MNNRGCYVKVLARLIYLYIYMNNRGCYVMVLARLIYLYIYIWITVGVMLTYWPGRYIYIWITIFEAKAVKYCEHAKTKNTTTRTTKRWAHKMIRFSASSIRSCALQLLELVVCIDVNMFRFPDIERYFAFACNRRSIDSCHYKPLTSRRRRRRRRRRTEEQQQQ